ncbi:MAG: hypothetical protein EZS28_011753 [Streblomastix strix]|uniref:Uncharacterized protein n=1 Tax=Streblomastix strix TaxID=222440 RepID=A0A5J4WEK5_9EUKA|nr:MAG: hypothetical protein EZS28_011753 [Streblomastix strix]
MVQPDIHDKERQLEIEKDTGCESVEQIDSRLPLQNARFERGETNNQTWRLGHFTRPLLRISPPNSPNRIITIPSIPIPEQSLHVQGDAIWNQTLTNVLCNSNGTNTATNMNENRDQNNKLRRQHPSPSIEQGLSEKHDLECNRHTEIFQIHNKHRKQRVRTELNSNISRIVMESSQRNSQNETEEAITSSTRSIQYEKMDIDRNRDNSKTNSQINRKTKLFRTIILRSFTLPEHNGPPESISCKNERMEYNDDNEHDCNSRYKLVYSEIQSEYPSTINTDLIINDNYNRCSTQWMRFNTRERTGNDSNCSWNFEQKINHIIKQQQKNQSYNLRPTKFRQNLKQFASSIPSDQKRQQYCSFRHQEMERINIINKENQTGTLNNRKARNLDPDYSPPRSQKRDSRRTKQTIKGRRLQTKGEDFSADMSSDELEPNNRFILTKLQQSTAKIHVNNRRTWRNSNRCSKSNMQEGSPMYSSSYPSPSNSSEEDHRRADRSNGNCSTMARPDMVHRTRKRECSIPYAWLEQRNSGTRNIVNQEEFETPAREDMLFLDGLKVRKGRRFTRKILRILNVPKGAIDMILYGQRYNTQRRYYYAIEKLKKWTQINHYTVFDLLTMKPHIIITEVLAQFTSVNTSASSALQFLNGLHSMLSLTFDIDLKNNHMFQFTRKAISAHIIVKLKYEYTQKVGILFDYWRGKGSNRNLTNVELQIKLTSLLMTICSMRPAEIKGISLRHTVNCEKTDKVDL